VHSSTRRNIQQAFSAFDRQWREYQASRRGATPGVMGETFALLKSYEALSGYLYQVRAELPASDPLRQSVEDAFASVSQDVEVYRVVKREGSAYRKWVGRYRSIWRENMPLFLITLLISLSTMFIGWHVTVQNPGYVAAFVPEPMMEQVIDQKKWFARLQENPYEGGLQIAINNILVTTKIFLGGTLLGLGGLVLLIFNDLMLGSLLGFCYVNHFNEQLTEFVIGHGPLELTICIAAAFASFIFGRVFYMRPYSLFTARLAKAGSESFCLLLGILPWLLLAAFIEAFVSPFPGIPNEVKLTIGILATALFWTWTLWPTKDRSTGEGVDTTLPPRRATASPKS
jgi:uncharacterized membrane protein SpoIIM required for sporulation